MRVNLLNLDHVCISTHKRFLSHRRADCLTPSVRTDGALLVAQRDHAARGTRRAARLRAEAAPSLPQLFFRSRQAGVSCAAQQLFKAFSQHVSFMLLIWNITFIVKVMSVLKFLFPVPPADSRRVVTFANDSDYIIFRFVWLLYRWGNGLKSF